MGKLIRIGRIDGINLNDVSYPYDGFLQCGNSTYCLKIIDDLNYENVAQLGWNYTELVIRDIREIYDYSTNLTSILKYYYSFFNICPYSYVILLTNRIVDMTEVASQDIVPICEEYCIEFFITLLGRNEINATKDLKKYFDYIPENFTFNVPNYNCVVNLIPCIRLKVNDIHECSNMTLNDCSPIPIIPIIATTKIPNTFHVTYILGFTYTADFNFNLVLKSLIKPLQDVADIRPINVNVIISPNQITQNIQTIKDFEESIQNIRLFEVHIWDEKEFMDRIKLGIRITGFITGEVKRMILLTDYFPPTNTSQSTNDFEILRNIYLNIYVYNHTSYELYEKNNISSDYVSDYSYQIPLISVFTSSTNTRNTTTASTAETSSTQMTRNNSKNKTLIIAICGIIIVGIVVVLISLFFYRKRIQRKRMEEIRLSHQNPSNIDEWELTWDKLMIKGEELGSGAFGQVLQGKLLGLEKTKSGKLIEEKEDVAIKILQRYTNEISEKNFLNEIQMMKQINGHKNIVKMIGCITVGDRICLVLEFCSYRDLLQYSKTKKTELLIFLETSDRLKEEFLVFAWEISQGMEYLASEGIIHRDLAARNILINEFKVAKISDFGLSVQINDKHKNCPTNNILQIETGKLPVKWLAIESLKNYEFSLYSDIWAFGIVLFEMYSFGETPFSEIENSQLLKHLEDGNRLEKPELCPIEIYEIMLKCWNSNPSFRPFFDELITCFTVFLEHSTQNYGYLDLKKRRNK